jgi:phage tail sheath protein FI
MTSVLLEAYRAGALKGETADQAFRVRCDDKTNPPEQRDLGRVVCEIEVAPAAPMEFILLRIALGGDGALEVFEP